LNSVSRTRSGVGLSALAAGTGIFRLRQIPPMMRTEPARVVCFPESRTLHALDEWDRIITIVVLFSSYHSVASNPAPEIATTVVTDAEPRKRGFFAKLKERLNQGKTWLGASVSTALGRNIDESTLEELEEELLLADVGIEATETLIADLRKRARRADNAAVPLPRLLRESVVELLEPLAEPLLLPESDSPRIVLVVGVNGTGKTTTIGKLAMRFKREGRSVLLAAGDTFRAAAAEQLALWAERSGSEIVRQAEGADPAAVIHDALTAARARRSDIVLADTAGRLHTAGGLMDELDKIRRVVRRFDETAPHEVLLVVDATQGLNALAQATEFQRRVGVTGLVITKLDGSAKGGTVLAIAHRLRLPIRFIGIGEAIEDFDTFDAAAFAAALVPDPA
jgi:fused signal recognition particle receptor